MRITGALLALATFGCSVAFPLSEYDEGTTGTGTTGAGAAGAAGGSGATGGTGAAGAAGGAGGSGGVGGTLNCGEFPNSGTSEVVFDFETGIPSSLVPNGNCITYGGGEAIISPTTVGEYCWLGLAGARHLTCDSFTVRISETGSQELGMQRYIYIRDAVTDDAIDLLQEVGGFHFGVLGDAGTFDPTRDFFWRVRATDTLLFFETSEDGEVWEERVSGPHPFPLDNIVIQFGAGMWQTVGNPGQAHFDCLNLTAGCP